MVFIIEPCGILCITIAYAIILLSNFTFIKVTMDNREEGEPLSLGFYLNVIIFEGIVIMILWAHIRTMITEPGYIPLGITEYDTSKLPKRV